MAPRFFAVALLSLLAACSSFGPDTPSRTHALDASRDDVASLVIAFDLPRGLQPETDASFLTFAVAGARPVKAMLVDADADQISGTLPPPAAHRAYYLFQLSPSDQAAIHAAQAGTRAGNLPPFSVSLSITPRLCRLGQLDARTATISVLASLPTRAHLAPLIDHQPLAAIADITMPLPACR